MNQVIINKRANQIDVCIVEKGILTEKYVHDTENQSMLGNIYVGVVQNVVDGMQAAFIDIGEKRNAFISMKDAIPKIDITKNEPIQEQTISEVVKVGEKLLVQVKKDSELKKGARVSTHITLPGNYVILMPNTDIITVSQKIENIERKEELKQLLKNNLPINYGGIVRTDAENVSKNDICDDIKNTISVWNEIKNKSKKIDKGIIFNDHDLVSRILRDLVTQNTEKIICNSNDIYLQLKSLSNANLEVEYIQTKDVFLELGMQTETANIEKRKIWLKCGGYIAIDKTEALTAIDVNSGKYTGIDSLEETALKVNEEAAIEIMKQIRLKDIGGIIVIDYIDMYSRDDQEKILNIMKNEAKKDRSKIEIKDFTKLNLVEMTRKKMYL